MDGRIGESERGTRLLTLALAHGVFNLAGGLWPLVSMRSFEAVSGPKIDRWLVRTVAGLTAGIGLAQIRAARRAALAGNGELDLGTARDLGIATALTFATIDLVYGGSGRISRTYLLDVPVELAWLAAWLRTGPDPTPRV
jgi:hypothetical protein